jgi:hypothetical protein
MERAFKKDYYKLVDGFRQYLREQEGPPSGEGGDEKLEKLIADVTDNVDNLSTLLGALPNYVDYIRKPNDPANDPEHNQFNVEKAKSNILGIQQHLNMSQKTIKFLLDYIKTKYNFQA